MSKIFHQFAGKSDLSNVKRTDDKVYILTRKAQKMPMEAKEGNASPAFLIAMPENATLQEVHNYICHVVDRPIKNYYCKIITKEEKEKANADAENASNDTKTVTKSQFYPLDTQASTPSADDQKNTTIYVPTHMLGENSDYKDASLFTLNSLGLDEGYVIDHLFKVTGAEWEPVHLLAILPGIEGESYPSCVRIVIRAKIPVKINGKEILEDVTPDKPIPGYISESQEEVYVQKMHSMFGKVSIHNFDAFVFTSSCIELMEYVRLHKLIKFNDESERTIWTASFLYSAAIINKDDPIFKRSGITKEKILEQFCVKEEILLRYHQRILKTIEEEGKNVQDFVLSEMMNTPIVKEQMDAFRHMFQQNSKSGGHKKSKILKFK